MTVQSLEVTRFFECRSRNTGADHQPYSDKRSEIHGIHQSESEPLLSLWYPPEGDMNSDEAHTNSTGKEKHWFQ